MPTKTSRTQSLERFVDDFGPSLSAAAWAVWLVLHRHAEGGRVTMPQAELARRTNRSAATVRRGLAELRALNLVACIDTRDGTREGAMTYTLQMPDTEAK